MAEIGDYLSGLRSDGRLESSGNFTVSLKKSLAAFAPGLKLEPHLYLLKAVQALIARGAPRVDIQVTGSEIRLRAPIDIALALRDLSQRPPTLSDPLSWGVWGAFAAGVEKVTWNLEASLSPRDGWNLRGYKSDTTEWVFHFPSVWSIAGLKGRLSRASNVQEALPAYFAYAPVPVSLDSRLVNNPYPELLKLPVGQLFTRDSQIRAHFGWLEASKPTLGIHHPGTYYPTHVRTAPPPRRECDKKILARPFEGHPAKGAQVTRPLSYYQLRLDRDYELGRDGVSLGLQQATLDILGIAGLSGVSEIKAATPASFEISPAILGARAYACFDFTGCPHGALYIVQDGLLHHPLETGITGLTLIVGASDLPVDANGLRPVVGDALRAHLAPLLKPLLQWHEDGVSLDNFWGTSGRIEWTRMGRKIASDFPGSVSGRMAPHFDS